MVPQQQRRRRRRAALPRTAERRVVIGRGAGGFGFTIAGQRPCIVSAVAPGGPAERAGLRAGDALLAVDGASVARAPHASVARLVAGAPGAISLSVAPPPREGPPTDTEDTEPDERVRTRRRHPPPRRRPQPALAPASALALHHPACHAVPGTSGVNEILQNLSRAQLTPNYAARLECRAVVGYLGTIETPQAASTSAPSNVRSAVRKLRQERRPATPVLLCVLPSVLLLRRAATQVLAQYHRDRILYAGCGSDADRRFFGLVTSADTPAGDTSLSCHIFAVDPRAHDHAAHCSRANEFEIACTRDPVAERCLEFPPSAEYVVGVIRGMYSLPAEECTSPALQQLSKLAVKGASPGEGQFARALRPRRPARRDLSADHPAHPAHSPQPSNHSEVTTASSNSDSGIGFHNDCRNIADRILVVDFASHQPPTNRCRQDTPRRPLGLVGCSSFEAESSFLSNTTPVVDGFGGQGRPLDLDDNMLLTDHAYHYNHVYGNYPDTSRTKGAVYDQVYTESEGQYEPMADERRAGEPFAAVEMYESRECQSAGSVENVTVISGGTSKASADSVSVCSLDDVLSLGARERLLPPSGDQQSEKHDGIFLHPASVKCKVRKSSKPLNILARTKHMLTGRDKKEERRRAMSASAGDVTGGAGGDEAVADTPLAAANSEPDLRDAQVSAPC
ncbi:hypothetical protein O0L34_g3242 [Tuta absoluta]|nr:hypothetical protein O0L34_g3242 [Tuta absoluta]